MNELAQAVLAINGFEPLAKAVDMSRDSHAFMRDQHLDAMRTATTPEARAEHLERARHHAAEVVKANHGEGSRGGHVIGHTKSGKPIYQHLSADSPEYKGFTSTDHREASVIHKNKMSGSNTYGGHMDMAIHGAVQSNNKPDGEAKATGQDLKDRLHIHLMKGGKHELRSLHAAMGHKDYDPHHPLENPVNQALVELQKEGKVDVHDPQGQPSFSVKSTGVAKALAVQACCAGIVAKSMAEGSRGGHVIGHTRSGKPIYGISHRAYAGSEVNPYEFKGWTANDHEDAKNAHAKAHDESIVGGGSYSEQSRHDMAQKFHRLKEVQGAIDEDDGTEKIPRSLSEWQAHGDKGGKHGYTHKTSRGTYEVTSREDGGYDTSMTPRAGGGTHYIGSSPSEEDAQIRAYKHWRGRERPY